MLAASFPAGTTFWEVNDSRCKSRAVAELSDGMFIDAISGKPISDMIFGEYVERIASPTGFDRLIDSLSEGRI
jgi:hypothetical protein